jgi:cell division protein FtsL
MSGGLFSRRVRGFRIIEVVALGVLLLTVLSVYLSKTGAGRENADIVRVEQEIRQEKSRLRLLAAEVAYLEQPERIERLSSQYLGLQPISAKREAPPEALADIARAALVEKPGAPPAPAVASAPAAAEPVSVPAPAPAPAVEDEDPEEPPQ